MFKTLWDTVIVGAGPAGLSAGIYTGRSELKTLLLEQLGPGGQLMITESIENYPGFPEPLSGFELADRIRKQAEKFGVNIKSGEPVTKIKADGNFFWLQTPSGTVKTKTIIWAAGSTARKLNVPGEAELAGRGVSYCAVCDGAFFKGKTIAVVGGGDSALEEAIYLTKFAKKVYIIHRRDKFRAVKLLQERISKNKSIEPLLNKVVVSINGSQFVESVTLKDTLTGNESTLKLDGVFIFIGTEPNVAPIVPFVDLSPSNFILTDSMMQTKTPGIFAAGDIREKPLRQVVTAVSDGAIAAMSSSKYIEEKIWGES